MDQNDWSFSFQDLKKPYEMIKKKYRFVKGKHQKNLAIHSQLFETNYIISLLIYIVH